MGLSDRDSDADNVAVAPVRPGQGPLASAVWYDAGGKVIASAGAGAESKRELEQIDAVNASRDRPIAPELVAHYRLFRSISPVDLARNPVLPTLGGRQGDLNHWQTRYITPGTRDLCISDWNAGECTLLTVPRRVVAIVNRDIHGRVVRTRVGG